MKIAVASENEIVTGHFGHCINFNIFEAENNQIIKCESIVNPGHKPGYLPVFFSERGVNVIISGGMGQGAIDIFNAKNIEVITGAAGNAKTAANNYLQGKLVSTGSVCHEHQHHDECGEHTKKATVNKEKCVGCGQCIAVCPVEAISLNNGVATVSDACVTCGACVHTCPVEAISL
jgi:predicted Fe-Mo cluster-binding NifX family protein